MAEFKVETNRLRGCATQIFALERELDAVNFKLGAMQLGSVLQIKASTALLYRINDCKRATGNQGDNLARLARNLEDIADLFENCETNLSEPKTQAQADARAEAEQSWLEDALEWVDGLPLPFLDWFGEVLGEIIGGVGGKAAGWAISLLQNTIGNYLEFDGFTPQMIYEMIGETAIDIAVGVGATALAALVIGGPVGLAAGLIGATAVWAVDGIVGLFADGRDLSEVIVDFLWDNGMDDVVNDIADGVGAAWNAAGEFIGDTVDVVREGAVAAWNAAGDFVDSIWPW